MIHSLASHPDLMLATALLGIGAMLLTGGVLGRLMAAIRQPVVVGEILAGIMFGPSVLGALPGHLEQQLLPNEVRPLLSGIGQLGLILFMFLIGWEFTAASGRGNAAIAGAVAGSSIVLSFGLGSAVGYPLYAGHASVAGHPVPRLAFMLFLGAAMSVTAFPVLARIISERGLANTRIGSLALACAAIDDLLAWLLLALVSAIVAGNGGAGLLQAGALSVAYAAVMFGLVRPALAAAFRRWGERHSPLLPLLLVSGAFVSAYATTWIGIHGIFGAFLFGIVLPRRMDRSVHEQARELLSSASTILMPVYFIVVGLSVDITHLSARNLAELAVILVVACTGKFAGSALPARLLGMSWRESRTVGLLMNVRGLTGIIILQQGISLGVLDGPMFTMMVLAALITTMIAGPLLPRNRTVPRQPAEPAQRARVPVGV
ncbi:MAG TPA: cation:proton antiporter [Jatrophihabitans sp.]|nr:cation:proton antiporter [Jatrophihabitans sp.]